MLASETCSAVISAGGVCGITARVLSLSHTHSLFRPLSRSHTLTLPLSQHTPSTIRWSAWNCRTGSRRSSGSRSTRAHNLSCSTKMPRAHKLSASRATSHLLTSGARYFQTQNPKLETREPKPETRNPKPEVRSPKPETRHQKQKPKNSQPLSYRHRKVDIRLHRKGNSSSHGVRPVYSSHVDDKVDSDKWVVMSMKNSLL